ncbi:DUF3099 domain-containing protein [Rarobacter incanus]|uniref:DUF3099 domain-containing protein n=1 Tax=Rarobacter incanus TaxID=153494 RepID=UPI001FE63A6E|nr:DUF3099 domain-containing protein [Rarobacter incanus]
MNDPSRPESRDRGPMQGEVVVPVESTPRSGRREARGGAAHTPRDPLVITSAPEPLTASQDRRMRKYLIQMGIRVVCFIASFFAWNAGAPLWIVGILVIAAAVLPYFAVVGANAGRESSDRVDGMPPELSRLLPATSDSPTETETSTER